MRHPMPPAFTLMRRRAPLLLGFTLLAACGKSNDGQARGTPAMPVRVAMAQRIDAPITITASGVVEPMQTVNVEAQASGTVIEVAFHQGDWVNAGQLLFRLDPRPLQDLVAQARAVLARDEAQAVAARHDAERYTTLANVGYVTRSQAEQMRAAAAAQEATVVADRSGLRIAERNLSYANIRAPISGRTGSVQLRRGDLVGPQTGPLVVINQLRPIQARFPVLATDFDLLRAAVASHPLPVRATSGDSSNISEMGQLSFLDNAIDSLTGTVTGRAVFGNAGSRLWPGQLVFLSVQAGVQRGVIAVPQEAVQTGQQGAYVFVVDPQKSTASPRNVAAGRTVSGMILVANGLNPGEQVVIDGQSRLKNGAKVAIVPPGRGAGGDTNGRTLSNAATFGGAVGGEVSTGGNGAPGGTVGANGGAAGITSNGAMATQGGAGVAASGGLASPYSGSPSTSGMPSGMPAGVGSSMNVGTGATAGQIGGATGVSGTTGSVRGGTPSATPMTTPGAPGTTSPGGVVRPTSPVTNAPATTAPSSSRP
jgi:multidrug efflux system membrane fusion protein